MKSWTVKNKIIFILASIIVFCMLLTSFLLNNQRLSDYKIKELYDTDYHAASDLAVIDGLLTRSDINIYRMMSTKDPVAVQGWKKENEENFTRVSQLIAKFKNHSYGYGEALTNINDLDQSYLSMHDAMLATVTAIESDNVKQAAEIIQTQAKPSAERVFSQLETIKNRLNDLAKKSVDSELSSSKLSLLTSVVIALFVMIYALITGVYLTRGILRQLGGEPTVAADAVNAMAGGELNRIIHLNPNDSTSLLAQLKNMQSALSSLVKNVRSNAENVATASAEISLGTDDLSQRTEEQASALQQTSATMEELTSTVTNNAENAQQANTLAHSTLNLAEEGGKLVEDVILCMQGISGSSKRIAEIISVIDGIAFQTNILALNAAVEAARAGEQGRGFAVVATEVRSLAQRSAGAAKEIHKLITTSVSQVTDGAGLVDKTGDMMTNIVNAIKQVSQIVNEISAASVEQRNGIAEVGKAISQMDQVTQQNAALVEESAAASESLKEQASSLVKTVDVFILA
ncbi:methyl-accepting chemotaxis protein [Acerihabitans sp. TG2]|uniref:methyl-accepting chemotaxis protein n=1 Tax=Acerihabitans sp. TG2 TaxID=3096008 RepID=UPI002B22D650|nr:methyl-accepting chemotaxis protein [Acerihabitans sp. TG2]MEA9389683.1 methyl-accepting chemotaxis protein [Acerihabitans sp. TG2]